MKLISLSELKRISEYPQYRVEPFRYFSTPISYYLYYKKGAITVDAYLLCHKGRCIALHKIKNEMIIDAEDEEDIDVVINGLLNSIELTEHEINALSEFFITSKEDIEEIIYYNWLKSKIYGNRIAIIRNMVYVINNDIYALGEIDANLVKEMGGIIVNSPVTEIVSYIKRRISPDFYTVGKGGIIFCNSTNIKCACFPLREVIDVITRKLKITNKNVDRWIKNGRFWYLWVGGKKYESNCPPKRENKENREETIHFEYITR